MTLNSPLQKLNLIQTELESTEDQDSRRRSRNGRIKVGAVNQKSVAGRPAGVVQVGNERIWTMHAMGGMTIQEKDAGELRG